MIKGTATITHYHADGSIETPFKDVCNHICWPYFRKLFMNNGNGRVLPTKRDVNSQLSTDANKWYIFYGDKDVHPTVLNGWYAPDAYLQVDQDTPTYTDGATANDPDVVTFTATLQAPTVTARTFRVLGLATNSPLPANCNVTILKLNDPCVQPVGTTTLITYRLFLSPVAATNGLRVATDMYRDLKLAFKTLCNAVNSTNIVIGARMQGYASTSYDFDKCNTIATNFVGSYSSDIAEELTDKGLLTQDSTATCYTNAHVANFSFSTTTAPATGTFIKHLYHGGSLYGEWGSGTQVCTVYAPALPATVSPVQNIFPQRNNPPGPFQDLTVNNTATMTGVLAFDDTSWVDPDFQRLVKVKVTNTGSVGVGSYRVETALFTGGFAGNRWIARTAIHPAALRDYSFTRRDPEEKQYETYIHVGGTTYRGLGSKLVLAASCNRLADGVKVYDIATGYTHIMNASKGLNVTAVSDGEVAKGYFFVTCANTGLWRMSEDLTVVEQIPSPTGINAAYQICVKNDAANTLWVMFDGGLCKLSNPDAAIGSLTWSVHSPTLGTPNFTFPTITTGGWASVTAMIVDPDELADDKFLILSSNLVGGSTANNWRQGYCWWSTGTGVASVPASNGITYPGFTWTLANLLNISDSIRCVGNRWLITRSNGVQVDSYATMAAFNAVNLEAIFFNIGPARFVPATINGVSGVLVSRAQNSSSSCSYFIKATTVSTLTSGTLNSGSASVEFTLRYGVSSFTTNLHTANLEAGGLAAPLVYLPESNMIFTIEPSIYTYGVTPFWLDPSHPKYTTYKGAFWKEYGWDGSAWVLNHGGNKLIHNTTEPLPFADNIGVSFTNGLTGVSFEANEYWMTAIGKGLLKDNGTTYNGTFSFSLEPTVEIPINDTVPQTPLGVLVDEPVTFQVPDANRTHATTTEVECIQNKGIVVNNSRQYNSSDSLISDQLIPASTEFDFRFKWISFDSNNSYPSAVGLAAGTTSPVTTYRLRYHVTTGNVELYNGGTLLGSVSNPSVDVEFRIVRDASNVIRSYYGGVEIGSTGVTIATALAISAYAGYSDTHAGWYDMKLSYTENRRVIRVGDVNNSTGSYNPKFSGLTQTGQAKDTTVLIGSGSPLTAILDYTVSTNPLSGTGRVKVAPGAGWLVFHDSEAANPVTGKTVAHNILNYD